MTDDLIKLAREAMGLQGVPRSTLDDECPFALYLVEGDGYEEWVWDLTDDSEAGWALGGVLLGALAKYKWRVRPMSGGFTWHSGDDYLCTYPWRKATTLSEACCRVAVGLGQWPGGAS